VIEPWNMVMGPLSMPDQPRPLSPNILRQLWLALQILTIRQEGRI
jgi:hypothetical protein